MVPLRHLRMVWNQLRRRGRGVLLAALLCTAAPLLLLRPDPGSYQQQQPQQRPVVPQGWRARQPAAVRRNFSREAVGVSPSDGPTSRGADGTALTGQLPGEGDTAPRKRSYVSGTRFVEFDPTEVKADDKTGAPNPALAVASGAAGSAPPSNAILPLPLQERTAPRRTTDTPTALNIEPQSAAGFDERSGPPAPTVTIPGAALNADSVTQNHTNDGNNPSGFPASVTGSVSERESPLSASGRDTTSAGGVPGAARPPVAVGRGQRAPSAVYQLPGCACSRSYSEDDYRSLNGTRSSCGITADLRGPRQKVISFSFYGNASSVFFGGIVANLARVPEVYPGWVVRVYHDIDLSLAEQTQLVCDVQCRYDNVDFCDVRDLPGLGDISDKFGMIWRFMPLADDTVERFIVRDLDSLIGSRERAAVDDWVASNRTFHAMRDAPAHGTEILGGMWGGWNRYNDIYRPVRDRIIKVTQWKFKGLDQRVLTVVLWPIILKHRDLVAHDSYLCYYYPMSRPFPTQRQSPFDFVGSPSLIDEGFRLQSHCPYFCRPRQHRDWQWC